MTDKEKKEYLKQYRVVLAKVDRAVDEISRMRALATSMSPVYSGMPHRKSNGNRVLDAVQRIIDLETDLNQEIDDMVNLRREIEASINTVTDERLRDILRRRYIDGNRMEQIAADLSLDFRWVQRLHAKAIQKLTVESHP